MNQHFRRGTSRRTFLQGAAALTGLISLRCAPTAQLGRDVGPPLAQRGGILRAVVAGDVPYLDPHSQLPAVQLATGLVYGRLVRPRAGEGVPYDSGDLIEDLAEKWEQADEVTHIFYLRRGVKWHDLPPVGGREMNSDDVRVTLERLAAMKQAAPSPAFTAIDHIDVPDRYTIKVILKEPVPFASAAANAAARIVPAELIDGDLRRNAVGTGPFFLDRSAGGSKLLFRRNPSYHRIGGPYLDGVEVVVVPDRAGELAALRNGLADIGPETGGMLPADGDALRAANGDIQVGRAQRPTVTLLTFNTTRTPFNDVRARKAMSLILDRRKLAADAYGDFISLSGHIPPSLVEWAPSSDEVEAIWGKRDPARAHQLWNDVGLIDGLELILFVHPQADVPGLVDRFIEQTRELGIRIRLLRPETTAATSKILAEKMFDFALIQPAPSTEPDDWTGVLYGSTSPKNALGYVDRQLDELILRSRRAMDREVRRRSLVAMQKYLADKLPAAPLFSPIHFYAAANQIKSWAPHWSAGLPGIEEAWLYRPSPTPTAGPAR